jgi:Tol biopolymer transport system component
MALEPGTRLAQYEIIAPLGAGSMGEVYRARDVRLERDVAIKVLPGLVSFERDRLLRFEQEAKAAAALNHPNILAVYQMGTYQGMPYLVSELLEGKTLTETIRRGSLPLRKVIDFGVQIASGLAAAHAKGIVHRDLKPDNLFVTKEGRVKILDFGLAKLIANNQTIGTVAATITLPGMALGTVGYMSPEQVRGQETDQRADIFALGAILYEMVTGKQTFQRPTSADTMSAILNDELPSLAELSPDTPAALERVIRRCLEKDRTLRFQSASDLAFALEALLDPTLSSPSGVHAAMKEVTPRQRYGWIAGLLAVSAAIVAVVFFLTQPPPVPTVANYVQLTHDGQTKTLIGTDGSRIYLGVGSGNAASLTSRGLSVISVAGGNPKKISVMPSSDMVPVSLSPDGAEVLYIDGQGAPPRGPLQSIPILGGSPRRLGDFDAENAAWSFDGKMLAYTNLGDLFVAKADGSDPRRLLSVTGDIQNVTWSPDGRLLRFDSSETAGTVGQRIEREVGVEGTNPHQLFSGWHNPPDECCGKWTPDGRYFIFQSQGQLWSYPSRAGLFRSEVKPTALTSSPLTLSSPLPSKDGKKLFMVGRTYRGELMSYDPKLQRFTQFLNGLSGEFLAFSKDGKWIAYVSYPDGTLWRSRVDGTDRLQLTYPPMIPVLPRWSPNGKSLLFFEFTTGAGHPARIYEISPDGGRPRALLPEDHSQQLDPNWSPDGSKVVFGNESNTSSSAIHILDLATHTVSSLPASDGLYSPRWSPDGRHISAFSADSKTLLLFDLQTQKWTKLANGSLSWLNWSHDGQYVYVLDYMGRESVVRIRISDHKVESVADVADFASTGRYGTALALTPSDDPVLLHDTGTQDIYAVDFQSY